MKDPRHNITPDRPLSPSEMPHDDAYPSGRIFTGGYAYVEPELTGEWPLCTVDQILAEYAERDSRGEK